MLRRIVRAFFALAISAGVSPAAQDPPDTLRSGPVRFGLDSLVRAEEATRFSLWSSSFTPESDEGRILFRLRPSVALSPSANVSARVEGQWYAFRGKTDFSIFSFYQGYVEAALPDVKGVSLRGGRQELVYGSTFLLGADTFYDGLTFDAAKLSWKPAEPFSLDLFGGRYVKKWAGGIEGTLYGIYGIYASGGTFSVDLYGFRDTGGAGAVHVGGEHEVTYSVGTRVRNRLAESISFEVEPVYQFGRKNRDGSGHYEIAAYGGHADITLDGSPGRHPGKIVLSYAYGSGDANPREGKFTEFHNPNNDTPLVGDMNVIGDMSGLTLGTATASGLQVIAAGGGVDLTDKLNLSLNGHRFRANKVPAGFSRDIGIETNLALTCKLNGGVSLLMSGNRFVTGKFFKDATGSGKDIGYVYAQLQATF